MKKSLSFLLILLLLAGCSSRTMINTSENSSAPVESAATPAASLDFRSFLREVNTVRKEALSEEAALPDISPFTPDYADELGTFTPDEIDVLLTPHNMQPGGLTQETAAEDIETFFRVLKTAYGGYYYFGGDAVFLPIKDTVLADLRQETIVLSSTLQDLLLKYLSPVLVDGHFSIGNKFVNEARTQQMYYVPELYFTDLAAIAPDYVKPTIAPDGSLQYCFAALSHDGSDLPKKLGGRTIEWVEAENVSRDESVAFVEREVDGLSVMESRRMLANPYCPEQKGQLERLSTCGGEYGEKPLFCFDVRANSGGYSTYSMEWFRGFSGDYPQLRKVSAKKHSDLFREMNKRWSAETGNPPSTYPPDGQWSVYENSGQWVEHAGIIFVLMDGGTASAGEEVLLNMKTVDNVVFVGSNTGGCYTITSNNAFYLPHSGLLIYLGQGLHLDSDGINRDGIGHLPDLWVNPADALDRVTSLCKYYNLR